MPKLNKGQMSLLARRFDSEGFRVESGPVLSARKASHAIYVDPAGLCWGSPDPSDYLLPSIPEVLSCEKEKASLDELLSKYFVFSYWRAEHAVRVCSRLESLGTWDALRASGGCGLAPDERLMATALLQGSAGQCRLVTDFVADESSALLVGRRTYYDSRLPVREASETLREMDGVGSRNAYIPRNGVLSMTDACRKETLAKASEALGEWCSFETS
ncbi:MAG: hypothetical protein JRM73_02205 [Nitrososphaerota archaeon]|nr:hypothetical protein [Nitrososphaerota archaeon]